MHHFSRKLVYITLFVFCRNLLPLRDLEDLDIKDNIEPQSAFITLKQLRLVDMSNNMLTFEDISETRTIALSHFKFCDSLEDIQLTDNSLTKIFINWQECESQLPDLPGRSKLLFYQVQNFHFRLWYVCITRMYH